MAECFCWGPQIGQLLLGIGLNVDAGAGAVVGVGGAAVAGDRAVVGVTAVLFAALVDCPRTAPASAGESVGVE